MISGAYLSKTGRKSKEVSRINSSEVNKLLLRAELLTFGLLLLNNLGVE